MRQITVRGKFESKPRRNQAPRLKRIPEYGETVAETVSFEKTRELIDAPRAVHTSNGTAVVVSRIGIGDQLLGSLSLSDLSYAIECCCRLLGEPALVRTRSPCSARRATNRPKRIGAD